MTFCHFNRWEDFVEQDAFSLARDAVAFVDIHFLNSRYDGCDIAKFLRKLGVTAVHAITADRDLADESQLFDKVFGKDVPRNFKALIAR